MATRGYDQQLTPAGMGVLWCDLDGEFLTTAGYRSMDCVRCRCSAVVRRDGEYLCEHHLGGLTPPEWFRLLTTGGRGS
jgi:hypothetical protein